MLEAIEANKITRSNEIKNNLFKPIEKQVLKSAKMGKSYCFAEVPVGLSTPYTVKRLENTGYVVHSFVGDNDHINNSYRTIQVSWGHAK